MPFSSVHKVHNTNCIDTVHPRNMSHAQLCMHDFGYIKQVVGGSGSLLTLLFPFAHNYQTASRILGTVAKDSMHILRRLYKIRNGLTVLRNGLAMLRNGLAVLRVQLVV